MDYIVNTFTYELEHGGPHVHFLAFILFIIIGIAIGVAIPNIFIHRYIESNKQRTVKDLLDKRYIQED